MSSTLYNSTLSTTIGCAVVKDVRYLSTLYTLVYSIDCIDTIDSLYNTVSSTSSLYSLYSYSYSRQLSPLRVLLRSTHISPYWPFDNTDRLRVETGFADPSAKVRYRTDSVEQYSCIGLADPSANIGYGGEAGAY